MGRPADERSEAAGLRHVRFASDAGGFNYDEVPLLHVHASKRPPRETDGAPSPGLAARR